jgi:hypothetical protein
MIDFIYKPKDSRIWRWKFRQQSMDKKIADVSLETSDKRCAEKRRDKLREEKLHERDGLILPNSAICVGVGNLKNIWRTSNFV